MAYAGVEGIAFITKLKVGIFGHLIAAQYLQGDLATAAFTRDDFDFGEQQLTQAQATKCTAHRHIVNIHQGFTFKGRKAGKAIGQARRHAIDIAKDAEGARKVPQRIH